MPDSKLTAQEQHEVYSQVALTEKFSSEDLKIKWDDFLIGLSDRPNLKSTLSTLPEIEDDCKLILEIENSVQEDLINSIKPDLVTWLRKELRNSNIQLITKISEKIKSSIIYSDSEKFEVMIQKNPSLGLLRQKFNLDFGT